MHGHARQFMNARVVVTFPHTTLEQAARELARLEVSGLPVVDQTGQVVGIVTESDLLSALLHTVSADTPISTIMTECVVTVDEFASADSVIRLLREKHLHHLPVMRLGVVVGLITPQDLIHYFVSHELPLPPEVA
jgi:CBS domain-containing protein